MIIYKKGKCDAVGSTLILSAINGFFSFSSNRFFSKCEGSYQDEHSERLFPLSLLARFRARIRRHGIVSQHLLFFVRVCRYNHSIVSPICQQKRILHDLMVLCTICVHVIRLCCSFFYYRCRNRDN